MYDKNTHKWLTVDAYYDALGNTETLKKQRERAQRPHTYYYEIRGNRLDVGNIYDTSIPWYKNGGRWYGRTATNTIVSSYHEDADELFIGIIDKGKSYIGTVSKDGSSFTGKNEENPSEIVTASIIDHKNKTITITINPASGSSLSDTLEYSSGTFSL